MTPFRERNQPKFKIELKSNYKISTKIKKQQQATIRNNVYQSIKQEKNPLKSQAYDRMCKSLTKLKKGEQKNQLFMEIKKGLIINLDKQNHPGNTKQQSSMERAVEILNNQKSPTKANKKHILQEEVDLANDRVYQIWKRYFLKDLRRCLMKAQNTSVTNETELNDITRNPEKLHFYVDGIIKVIQNEIGQSGQHFDAIVSLEQNEFFSLFIAMKLNLPFAPLNTP